MLRFNNQRTRRASSLETRPSSTNTWTAAAASPHDARALSHNGFVAAGGIEPFSVAKQCAALRPLELVARRSTTPSHALPTRDRSICVFKDAVQIQLLVRQHDIVGYGFAFRDQS